MIFDSQRASRKPNGHLALSGPLLGSPLARTLITLSTVESHIRIGWNMLLLLHLFSLATTLCQSVLRWRASNVMQPCNNWRRGFRFTALECRSRSCRGHPRCHATCLVPRLFLGLYWPRSKLSTTLYVLCTMTMPTANLGEIPCYFSVHLKNQLNDFSRNGLRIQLLH